MKSLGDILWDLQDILSFWRGRSRAWKELAKKNQETLAFHVANPGLSMARHILSLHDGNGDRNDIADMVGIQACETMGWAFAEYLRVHPEAPNYLEATLLNGTGHEPVFVTIQRPGGKTPNQLKDEALKRVKILEAENEALENRNRVLAAEVADQLLTAQDREGVTKDLTRKVKKETK